MFSDSKFRRKSGRRGSLAAGLDDAGRGSVIGPLIVAGVLHPYDKAEELRELGVKDSKLLSPAQRQKLAVKIKATVTGYSLVEIKPAEIDRAVLKGRRMFRLNFLEAKAMAELIERLRPPVVWVDAADVLAERFGKQIEALVPFPVKVISQHHADFSNPFVGAASVLAKVHRDSRVAELREAYGDFGSGYPGDRKTQTFLRRWLKNHRNYPAFVRKSWKTAIQARLEVLRVEKLDPRLLRIS